ncbi:MAG: exosome nuclease subunit [Piccolia ochrophora]|nr:MAG: exosome nuclease subunit [Piccolia ochrophora]
MDPTRDYNALQGQISSALVTATKTAGRIAAEDLPFLRSLDPDIGEALDQRGSRLLKIAEGLLQSAVRGTEVHAPSLHDADDLENNWRGVVDVIDSLLEKADTCLDEYTGIIKKSASSQKEQSPVPAPSSRRLKSAFRNQDIPKPQLSFVHPPDNHDKSPFKPLLTSKPNSIVPFEESFGTRINDVGSTVYEHPYDAEIVRHEYPTPLFECAEPIPYTPFDSTAAIFVDTPAAVSSMLAHLKGAHEIAVDLEHHDSRSYVGVVSLMQISTRTQDYIVDTLKPWRRELEVLNEVFTDPQILKVFHGAFMDVVWLQRDLGLYLVGLFDTYHAARALGYPQASLAALLSRFTDFKADKKYQMADWRIRPLPTEMFNYARSDTHFLLFIYDKMRNELIDKRDRSTSENDPLADVLENSGSTALIRYEKFVYDEKEGKGAGGWYNMLNKTPAMFSREQFAVFRAVHQWRDVVSRQNDDGANYTMPKHVIFNIARSLPADMPALLSVCHPISAPVRARTGELLAVIQRAKIDGSNGPDMETMLRPMKEKLGQALTSPRETGKNDADSNEVDLLGTSNAVVRSAESGLVRSSTSRFWGSAFGSSVWTQPYMSSGANADIGLALPLPQLTAEIFENPKEPTTPYEPRSNPGSLVEHAYVKARGPERKQESETFTIKQLGGGRKRSSNTMESVGASLTQPEQTIASQGTDPKQHLGTDEKPVIDDDDDDVHQLKKRKKVERKARKEAKRVQNEHYEREKAHGNGSLNGQSDTDVRKDKSDSFDPFDYTKAESVLHAPQESSGQEPKRAFDPYAKSGDAPSGKRRGPKEIAGRSFTFRG